MLCFCQTILPSEKIFFLRFGNFQKYFIVPNNFHFKTFQLTIQATQVPPPYFFHMWTRLWTLSCEKKTCMDRYGSNYVRKVTSNHCFHLLRQEESILPLTPPEKK